MIHIRKWALVLCLASLFTSYSNSQQVLNQPSTGTTTELVPGTVYSTGNIVQQTTTSSGSTWTGAVYQDNLSCWAWGDPGYCGPNAIVRPGNALNFSYGSTYVYQQQHINTIVPSGSGLQVNGYTFGFTAKNGNGWDGGGLDSLTALVRFWDNTGYKGADNLLYGTSYNLNYKFNWTNFSYSENFKTPLAVPDIGLVQYGFIGRDNNGWAGPYGPEITSVNFSVKYSVDPCASNPLYSPTCKGYLDALSKLLPATTSTTVATTDGTQTATIDTTTGLQVSDPTQPASLPGSQPPPLPGTEPPSGSPPPPPPGSPPPASNSNPVAAPANQPPPQGGSSQPKIGEVKTAGDSNKSTSAGPSLSNVMSMIGSNQARIGNEAKTVVQAAESQAQQAATAAQQQAETVAGTAVVQSTSSSTTGSSVSVSTTAKTSTQTQVGGFALPAGAQATATSIEAIRPPAQAVTQESTQSTGNGLTISSMPYQTGPTVMQSTASTASPVESPLLNFGFQLPAGRNTFQSEPEAIPQLEGIKIGTRSTLNDVMEQRPMLQNTSTQEQKTDAVNKNVQSNELAGGVDIRSMAQQPQGYQAYSTAMPDVAFYAPKEIYKNQVNVDNVRLLRGLGSDRLHQEMVNQQYKIGN